MPLSQVVAALTASNNPAADDALVAALHEAGPEEIAPLIEAILVRKQPAGLTGLISAYHRLEKCWQERVVAAVPDLYGPLRDACSKDDPQIRLNVIAIVEHAACCRLGYLLNTLLRDPVARVRQAAALALRSVTDRFLSEAAAFSRRWETLPADHRSLEEARRGLLHLDEDRRRLKEAVAAGIDTFDVHHHVPVLEAGMWLHDDLKDRLWRALRAPTGRARRAAIEILRRSASPRLAAFAIEALAHPDFRPHAIRVLVEKASGEMLAEAAYQSWRMTVEPVRKGMAYVKEWPELAATPGQRASWASACPDRVVRLIRHSALPADTKLELLRPMVFGADSEGRRAALWALCDIRTPAATNVLQAIERHGDERIARIARRERRRRATHRNAECAAVPQRQTSLRAESGSTIRASPLEQLWAAFDSLGPAEQTAESAALLTATEHLNELVENRLTSDDPLVRTRALRMLAFSGRAPDVAEAVYPLARDADPIVRSTALSTLGGIATPASERILRSALNDPDARARANAIESLERLSAGRLPELCEKLRDPDNRVRANAAKALLKLGVREAAEVLCTMLRDPRARQRLSALWVVERLRLAPLLSRIAELAENDPDLQVRERARCTLAGLPGRAPASIDGAGTEVTPWAAS